MILNNIHFANFNCLTSLGIFCAITQKDVKFINMQNYILTITYIRENTKPVTKHNQKVYYIKHALKNNN